MKVGTRAIVNQTNRETSCKHCKKQACQKDTKELSITINKDDVKPYSNQHIIEHNKISRSNTRKETQPIRKNNTTQPNPYNRRRSPPISQYIQSILDDNNIKHLKQNIVVK